MVIYTEGTRVKIIGTAKDGAHQLGALGTVRFTHPNHYPAANLLGLVRVVLDDISLHGEGVDHDVYLPFELEIIE